MHCIKRATSKEQKQQLYSNIELYRQTIFALTLSQHGDGHWKTHAACGELLPTCAIHTAQQGAHQGAVAHCCHMALHRSGERLRRDGSKAGDNTTPWPCSSPAAQPLAAQSPASSWEGVRVKKEIALSRRNHSTTAIQAPTFLLQYSSNYSECIGQHY